ncbi:MAG TPA: PP2C family protein-serine/threonine phosphatase [Silvibacterium sp.]|jgi:sigma-B regulation protein RsbU (phosphoserine phosphatase)|nr:PP2C family protein-serine/threonine phosphatase [Silvibacterium sp.]
MSNANSRRTFLSGFNLLRFQLILLLVAICVRVVFWALHLPARTLATVIFTFVAGNASIALILPSRRLFQHRPRPWNLIGYVILLLGIGVIANIVAEIPIFLLFSSPSSSFPRAVLADAPLGIIVTLIVGILHFAFDESRARLEARNQQLQSQVQLGLMEQQTHQSDLEQAHDIQVHLLPRETPQIPGFQIACAWQPALTVSGDYFDVLPLAKDRLGLCIADVSGKGMAAALLMANLQASVKAFTQDGGNASNDSPAELCAKLNTALCNNIAPGRFVTFFYGILDSKTRVFKYENAGHCLPLLVHADGAIEFPAAYSGVLGLFSHWTYSDREVQLTSGDVLLLMTDGVLEASDDKEEEFGYQRLIASVLAARGQGVHAIRQRILADVTAFCSNNFQDDASLIVITVD